MPPLNSQRCSHDLDRLVTQFAGLRSIRSLGDHPGDRLGVAGAELHPAVGPVEAQAVSFLPGFPDGSFGWAKVWPHLPNAAEMPRLFVDYVGMGDSDKPKDYAYSTAERADLVEAIWRSVGVGSTMLVAFDFSSLVVLEILQRRLERAERGKTPDGPAIRGVFIFNGGDRPRKTVVGLTSEQELVKMIHSVMEA